MMVQGKQADADLLQSRLALRDDLRCSLHEHGGKSCYVVEDPVSSHFYRFGVREWTFVTFLDGKNSVEEAMELAAEILGPDRLAPPDVIRLARWLLDSRLANGNDAHHAAHPAASATPNRGTARLPNPFFARVPLCNPDRALAAALPWLGWIFSGPCFFAWCILGAIGAYRVVEHWDRFLKASEDLLSPDQWLYLATVWVVLKIIHEAAHGLACKKYGGSVPTAGITFILFSPIAFTDLTSCWRIRSKWQRIVTSVAGVYAELGIAAAAAILWSRTDPGPWNDLCHKVVLMAGVTAILFNFNPLMRFDGYYALSDLLGIPNLYSRGQAYLSYLGRRYLLGLAAPPPAEPGLRGLFVKFYGAAALAWRIVTCLGLGAAAATMFHGLGLVLTVLAAASWIGLPAIRFVVYLAKGDGQNRPPLWQAAWRIPLAAACAAGCLLVPMPAGTTAPAIVQYAPLAVVRVDSPGFVQRVCVRSGEYVPKGHVLAILENDELQFERESLDLDIQQSRVRSRILYNDGELAKYQAELRDLTALETRRAELEKRLGKLTVRSPVAGYVVGRELDTLAGRYLPAGAELLSVGEEDRKELLASVAQDDVDRFGAALGRSVTARIWGRAGLIRDAKLASLSPKASCELPSDALSARAGGPLAVKPREAEGHPTADALQQYDLLAPRFEARLPLPPLEAAMLRAGELATVRLRWHYESIGSRLYRWLEDHVLQRLK